MLELNFFIYAIAFTQLLNTAIIVIFSRGNITQRVLLITLTLCLCLSFLKPVFHFYNLKLLFYVSIFSSSLLPLLVYLIAHRTFQNNVKFNFSHYFLLFFSVGIAGTLVGLVLFTKVISDYLWIFYFIFFPQLLLTVYNCCFSHDSFLVESRFSFKNIFIVTLVFYCILSAMVYSHDRNNMHHWQSYINPLVLMVITSIFNLHYFFDGYRMFGNMETKLVQDSSEIKYDQLQRIQRLLEKAIDKKKIFKNKNLTISDLSKETNITQLQLRHFINKKLDYRNFQDFINQKRLQEAKRLLTDPKNSTKKIIQIAMLSGFASTTSFNRLFKQYIHHSPSEFKKKKQRL